MQSSSMLYANVSSSIIHGNYVTQPAQIDSASSSETISHISDENNLNRTELQRISEANGYASMLDSKISHIREQLLGIIT